MSRTIRVDKAVGLALIAVGLLWCASYFFLRAAPVSATGVAAAILGLTIVALCDATSARLTRTALKFMVTLLVAFTALVVLLGLLEVQDIALYFICFDLAFFLITLGTAYLDPASHSSVHRVSSVLFAGFIVALGIKLVQMVG